MEDETTTSEDTAIIEPEGGAVTAEAGDTGLQETDNATDTSTAETPEGTGPASLPANERIQQLVSRADAKDQAIKSLEEKLSRIEQSSAPSFPELPYDRINDYVNTKLTQIDELRFSGQPLKALDLQEELTTLRKEIKDYELKRNVHLDQGKDATQQAATIQRIDQQLIAAAELVRSESKMTSEVWDASAKFFEKARQENPLIEAQFRETAILRGPVAAIMWAKEYIEQNMGKQFDAVTQQKESSKGSLPGGKSFTPIPTVIDLDSLRARATKSGDEDDFLSYIAAKRQVRAG